MIALITLGWLKVNKAIDNNFLIYLYINTFLTNNSRVKKKISDSIIKSYYKLIVVEWKLYN